MPLYTIVALDADGCTLSESEADTLASAQALCRDSVKERELIEAGLDKCEVRDARGRCVYDRFPADRFADKLHAARATVSKAQAALGVDLGGHSVVDLLADNHTGWTLDECRNIAAQLGA